MTIGSQVLSFYRYEAASRTLKNKTVVIVINVFYLFIHQSWFKNRGTYTFINKKLFFISRPEWRLILITTVRITVVLCISSSPLAAPEAVEPEEEGEEDFTLPCTEDVICKTEQITKNIQELLRAAQETKHERCSMRSVICNPCRRIKVETIIYPLNSPFQLL